MINNIAHFIQKNNLIPENSKLILGLSGGPDSVFLLYILYNLQKTMKFELIAAHLDHEWRSNSNLDILLCKKICSKLHIKFISKKASELDAQIKFKGSKEEFARNLRRHFFSTLLKELNADKVVLAHHLNDQEETFLIRLIRGTSLSGLTCMKPLEDFYIRPLLEVKKSEILQYLQENKIDYIIDYTNESNDFLRNRIRNNVISELQKTDSRFDDNFLRTLNKLQETEKFIKKIVEEKFEEVNSNLTLDLNKLFIQDQFLINKIIFYWLYKSQVKFELTQKFLEEIIRFLKQTHDGTHILHREWAVQKKQNFATIKHPPFDK